MSVLHSRITSAKTGFVLVGSSPTLLYSYPVTLATSSNKIKFNVAAKNQQADRPFTSTLEINVDVNTGGTAAFILSTPVINTIQITSGAQYTVTVLTSGVNLQLFAQKTSTAQNIAVTVATYHAWYV
jgi:hypothetical protein